MSVVGQALKFPYPSGTSGVPTVNGPSVYFQDVPKAAFERSDISDAGRQHPPNGFLLSDAMARVSGLNV